MVGTFASAPSKVVNPESAIPVLGKIEVRTSTMRSALPKIVLKCILAEFNTRSMRPPSGVTWPRTRWMRLQSPQCRNSRRRLTSPKSSGSLTRPKSSAKRNRKTGLKGDPHRLGVGHDLNLFDLESLSVFSSVEDIGVRRGSVAFFYAGD